MKIKEQMNQKEREKKMKSNSKNELVKLISICGQVAEHKSEKMQEKKWMNLKF